MAITKTLISAIPYNEDSEVQEWNFTMKYEEGADATYYTSSFDALIVATDDNGNVNFTPKAEALWTLAQLTALCPTDTWDTIFDSQYDSVITNPPTNCVANLTFVIPS